MFNTRQLFHYISYLQYPLVLIGVYYAIVPYFTGFDAVFFYYNKMLVFMGLSISFSTLQDTRKTQNAVSRKIWESPVKGKIALAVMSVTALFFIVVGFYGIYAVDMGALRDLSFGILVLGIGFIGMLKAAIEMFENHRRDKNPA
jgi:hypothetical protein